MHSQVGGVDSPQIHQQSAELQDFSQLSSASPLEAFEAYGRQLSTYHQLPDGSPVPPSAEHVAAAYEEGWGASRYVIERAIGGIGILQEMAGFVPPAATERWTDRQWIDNGVWLSHMLGSPEAPVMPKVGDIRTAAKLRLIPNEPRIVQEFGSVGQYQDALGFVSPATLERWTDQDWIDNGVWFSQLLGSPDEPATPSKSDLEIGSSLRLTPHPSYLRQRYGSLAAYQRQLGFVPSYEPRLDYRDWDRETFRQNGVWLSHMLGTPEQPVMPKLTDVDEGAKHGLCPPRQSAFGGFRGSLLRYQDAIGFVNEHTLERWTDQDWMNNGVWLSHAAGSPDMPAYVGKALLNRAAELNIGPSAFLVRKKFGDLYTYQSAIGQEMPEAQSSRRLSIRQVLAVGRTILREEGRAYLTLPVLAEHGVSEKVVRSRFGTMASLNERLGAPDYPNFTKEEVVRHGMYWSLDFGRAPATRDIKAMASNKTGPSLRQTLKYFDGMADYQQEVTMAANEYLKLLEELTESVGVEPALASYVLQDFTRGEEYYETATERGMELQRLHTSTSLDVMGLLEMFGRSRTTALWTKEDFYYFGGHVHRRISNLDRLVDNLQVLDRLGLSPYLDEITEEFGSLNDFLQQSMAHARQAR